MKRSMAMIAGSLGLFACGSTTNAVRYDSHTAGTSVGERQDRVVIEERVTEECNLPKGSTYFAYDSAAVEHLDEVLLGRVASCMLHGPLRGEVVIVIGYADARGTAISNKELGLTRAEAVADALVLQGVPKSRLFVKSYGEVLASDKATEQDFARDRKVTLRVADPH